MELRVVKYGEPVLRQKGERISKITPEIKALIADMLETMEANHGVGLAAQQIGRALQLAVIDVTGIEDRPSTLEIDGKAVPPETLMPLVLINPEIKPVNDPVIGPEGCLSFPEIYSDIARPETVYVTTLNAEGETIHFRCGGLLSRAVQHETDHLNGILFIDRMTKSKKDELRPEIDELQAVTKAEMKKRK